MERKKEVEQEVWGILSDAAFTAFTASLRQTHFKPDGSTTTHYEGPISELPEFAPMMPLLDPQNRMPRREARRVFRCYVRGYMIALYRDLKEKQLEPVPFWREMVGLGATWIRLQLAAAIHAVGFGIRVQATKSPAHPTD